MFISTTKKVAALVIEMKSATVDDLLPLMPGKTRAQVFRALKAAKDARLIDSDGHQPPKGSQGSPPTTYRPIAFKKPARPASSVWDFAGLVSQHA
jgi:hypothetical protein